MRVLITGCAGFIGWKVSELLLRDGHTVVGLDNLNSAYPVVLKEWRLSQLEMEPSFTFCVGDITDRQGLRAISSNEPFDGVINLAARAGVRKSLEDPWIYYETNLIGTLNLLDYCREKGVPKVVLASTSSVYGNGERPFSEDALTDKPLSPYAASKKAAEILGYVYHNSYGLDVTVLRFFTVYGPAGRPDMAPFRFIRWISEGEPVVVYGDGSQERDFTYVEDIARGTEAALRLPGFQVINLGSDRPVAVRDFIPMLEEIVGKPACIQRHPAHAADVQATWADITKARKLLGWEPKTNLREGLTNAVAWYRENRSWVSQVYG